MKVTNPKNSLNDDDWAESPELFLRALQGALLTLWAARPTQPMFAKFHLDSNTAAPEALRALWEITSDDTWSPEAESLNRLLGPQIAARMMFHAGVEHFPPLYGSTKLEPSSKRGGERKWAKIKPIRKVK
jgi:hypothetical protein